MTRWHCWCPKRKRPRRLQPTKASKKSIAKLRLSTPRPSRSSKSVHGSRSTSPQASRLCQSLQVPKGPTSRAGTALTGVSLGKKTPPASPRGWASPTPTAGQLALMSTTSTRPASGWQGRGLIWMPCGTQRTRSVFPAADLAARSCSIASPLALSRWPPRTWARPPGLSCDARPLTG